MIEEGEIIDIGKMSTKLRHKYVGMEKPSVS